METVQTGFWFAPMLMLALSCALALLLLYADEQLDPGIKAKLPWAYSGGPEGARSLLSTIAGSMITAASVTFSLASVALSIASQQYGSRVLRNFMRDRITQVLLGTFVSTFIYSVLVVRTIRGSDISGGFVPAISVTVAIALSVASLILLIYFIHHVSSSIQASRIVRVIAEDMENAINTLCPSETGEPMEKEPSLRHQHGQFLIHTSKSGYLQAIDLHKLLEVGTNQNIFIEVIVKPGDHLIKGDEIARVFGGNDLQLALLKPISGAFIIGGERTPTQDIRFQFQQLTDVVLRALSPGINDPFTAINGIDELATGMALLVENSRACDQRRDKQGVLRLTLRTPTVGEVLELTVGHIAIYASGDRFVMDALRKVLAVVERQMSDRSEFGILTKVRMDLNRLEQAKSGV